jgi:hypothetical protein
VIVLSHIGHGVPPANTEMLANPAVGYSKPVRVSSFFYRKSGFGEIAP